MGNHLVQNKKYYLSACLIAKNEGRYLLEWIAFHLTVGFEHFYIYDNDSTDQTKSMLNKLQDKGICTYIEWPRSKFEDNPQVHAYRHMAEKFGHETNWVAIIDADEFIVPLASGRVDGILRDHFSDAASVLCNWRIFGSSGQTSDDGRLCIERFVKSAEDSFHANNHVKAICRPELIEMAFIHNHYMKSGPVVLSDGSAMSPVRDQLTQSPVYGMMQVNHYYCKSLDEFMLKRAKGLADYPLDHPTAIRAMDYFFGSDRNEVDDNSAYRFLDEVKTKYDMLSKMI